MIIRNGNDIVLRRYQDKAVTECLSFYGTDTPYVLAACPSSGKTIMSVDMCIKLIESGKANRILVLAHSTTVIKSNFYEECEKFIQKKYVSDCFDPNAKIHVTLPQSEGSISDDYDIIIVDEAHQNYLAERVQSIKNRINPKLTILLTGTPSCFIALGDSYKINVIGMNDIGMSAFHNVGFKLIKSEYDFNINSYNRDLNLKESAVIGMESTKGTINNVIYGMTKFIAKREGVEFDESVDHWEQIVHFFNTDKFGKTLIACQTIEQAEQVSDVLTKNGISCRTSHSKNDPDSELIYKFKDGKINVLCVVGRAREGYDDGGMINMVDMTMTLNIDLIYQMYARVVRPNKEYNKEKLYIKVCPNVSNMPEFMMSTMSAALMLSNSKYLSTYNGRNFRQLEVPQWRTEEGQNGEITPRLVRRGEVECTVGCELNDEGQVISPTGDVVSNVVPSGYELSEEGQLVNEEGEVYIYNTELTNETEGERTQREQRDRRMDEDLQTDIIPLFSEGIEGFSEGSDVYATATIDHCYKVMNGSDLMSAEETFQICVDNELVSITKYLSFREISDLNINYNPWRATNEECADYFQRVKDALGIDDSFLGEEETFQICIDNELTSDSKYKNFRKGSKIKIHSTPWVTTKESQKKYFQRVKDALDIVDPETGKTDRELNMEKVHDIPLKSLVECNETGLRLYVVKHMRDCDETPLYGLSHRYDWGEINNGEIFRYEHSSDEEENMNNHLKHTCSWMERGELSGGYNGDYLTVIKTPEETAKDYE